MTNRYYNNTWLEEDKEPDRYDGAGKRLPVAGEHMESITARCTRCLMKSVFVFRQQYILLGALPMGLLQTHMEVICSNSSAE